MYLHGRMLAEPVSLQIVRMANYPRQAPQGDSYADYVSPDYRFATG